MRYLLSTAIILLSSGCGMENQSGYMQHVRQNEIYDTQLKKEFTGNDAEKVISAFKRLGVKYSVDSANTTLVSLSKVDCTLGGGIRWDPEGRTECLLYKDNDLIKAEAESERLYKIFLKNGASVITFGNKTKLVLNNLECMTYTFYRGTSKCYYNQ